LLRRLKRDREGENKTCRTELKGVVKNLNTIQPYITIEHKRVFSEQKAVANR